ncbi:MAG TPA: TetR family transcriptional regulator [Acidimicrobiales bacterium]|jgi:AcrR family transcriptional regulator|nr:TetR family transcriptional regulator [Acidimicrobiales bacterium]
MVRRASLGRTRPYHSPKRRNQARQTRRAILAAAADQFRTVGYAGATMGAIAAAAGVSVPTVELAFGTKADLLKVAIDVAIAGDDEPVPVLERPWAAHARAARTTNAFLAAVAEVLAEAAQRSDALVLVAFEAARSDERLTGLAAQLKAQRSVTAAWIVDGLAARARLRPDVDRAHAIDVIWLLMDPAVFDRLTTDRGWSPERFAAWFADSASRLLAGYTDDKEGTATPFVT